MRALRSPNRSPSSFHTHLIPETGSTVGEFSDGYLYPGYSRHRNAPSDVPTSPSTPNSPWTITEPTLGSSPSSNQTTGPQLSVPTQDEYLHRPTHTREDTMSSTVSNLQVEVVTLSGSPPDPGFVLPIPSRFRSRQNLDLFLASTMEPVVCGVHACALNSNGADLRCPPLQGLGHVEDALVDYEHLQITRATPYMNGSDVVLSPLELPRLRPPSWMSESSEVSLAVISTAARLTRANTTASAKSVTIQHTSDVRTGQQSTVTNEHPLGNPPSN
jgi:hypothetical protein